MPSNSAEIKKAAVRGYGAEVIEDPFNEENLFATIFSALDIDPHAEFKIDGFPTFHHVENKAAPISQILS